ncbi:hypothetical protein A2917_00400 [Candidatus Nomurabacteria bacterium RIFCSPLOWO2_01_FULL_42_17]|uniref:DUF5678 domain-containing protein n=1 Tax=Candidatus Nomurabacteria bacterium RIFCSPLOWO2_01_FULL_42_17 TaxID=1801780 RepID=A0A1F6XNU7_9BACT|nr:MAG: hypothetical protein A2917_00400 [Candidatus Nomurabacteria bacterium RIFCSPLOWO2_01_FULL_42_17]
MKNSDLTKILNRDHENKWVALSANRDKVLGASSSLVELKNKISNKDVIYMKVQPRDVSFAF